MNLSKLSNRELYIELKAEIRRLEAKPQPATNHILHLLLSLVTFGL